MTRAMPMPNRPNSNPEVERVRQARIAMERIRARLLKPDFQAIESCARDLASASESLRRIDTGFRSPVWQGAVRQRMETEVTALRAVIRSVEELLKNAGRFYAGLARLMSPDNAPGNYTAAGTNEAPPLETNEKTLVLHG
jgi:hypothetical protein